MYNNVLTCNSKLQSNVSNTDAKGTEPVLERCLYKRGHYDDITFMTPHTVLRWLDKVFQGQYLPSFSVN